MNQPQILLLATSDPSFSSRAICALNLGARPHQSENHSRSVINSISTRMEAISREVFYFSHAIKSVVSFTGLRMERRLF